MVVWMLYVLVSRVLQTPGIWCIELHKYFIYALEKVPLNIFFKETKNCVLQIVPRSSRNTKARIFHFPVHHGKACVQRCWRLLRQLGLSRNECSFSVELCTAAGRCVHRRLPEMREYLVRTHCLQHFQRPCTAKELD